MNEAAGMILEYTDFRSFSKRNTQVKTFECSIKKSAWQMQDNCMVYNVQSNRFLRGMVRGLVGTMLQVGRGKLSTIAFQQVIENGDASKADFSVPGHGLFLVAVNYPSDVLRKIM
jgi:tRNA pseudouridine38-40 synthase